MKGSILITLMLGLAVASFAGEEADSVRWEGLFRSVPNPDSLREHMRRLSARPHHLGSDYDRENAEWILQRLKSWGWDAHIETFDVLFPTPLDRVVELVEPTRFVAQLREPPLSVDPTSSQQSEQLPTYNAYSADGDVTAPLVYVNYGNPDDYEELARLGVSVKGAIVITRYGTSWRGLKPKLAAEHGAVGCLIYSDPSGDGRWQGDVYPKGPWRPPEGVQRGSVMDMIVYPGDPLTPGTGSTEGAKRLALKDAKTIMKIPVLPLSYADAQPLMAALAGPVAPEGWRGSLAMTYHVGPGPARVHLKVRCAWDQKRLYDVIGKITGAEFPNEWVIRGNHHDAWVNGAEDPISGTSALLEEARAFGVLLHKGWKPRRTILYCAWDGEEEGLLGSTEWAETHADELRQHAALYINSDSNGRGFLEAGGSHSLEKFLNDVARDISDPETGRSVWKRLQMNRLSEATTLERKNELRNASDLELRALGSGSDYTVFLDHLGIASLNLGYGGEDGGGIYHSIYDDFYWYTHFSDTAFVYGRALAQTAGTAILRYADAGLLPVDFLALSRTVEKYLDEVETLAKKMRNESIERDKEIAEGLFAVTADPREVSVPPPRQEIPPFLDFAPMENAAAALKTSAERYRDALHSSSRSARVPVQDINAKLIRSERVLTDEQGLPGRPWFEHELYAPGRSTGYGAKTIPAIREAVEQRKWKEADEGIRVIAHVLEREAALIDSAAGELEKASR